MSCCCLPFCSPSCCNFRNLLTFYCQNQPKIAVLWELELSTHFVKTQQLERWKTQVKGYLREMLPCVHHSCQFSFMCQDGALINVGSHPACKEQRLKWPWHVSFRCPKICEVNPYMAFVASFILKTHNMMHFDFPYVGSSFLWLLWSSAMSLHCSTECMYLYLCFGVIFLSVFISAFQKLSWICQGPIYMANKLQTFHGVSGHRYDNSFKRPLLTLVYLHKWNPEATKDHKKQILIQRETRDHFRFKWLLRYFIYSSNPHNIWWNLFFMYIVEYILCTLQSFFFFFLVTRNLHYLHIAKLVPQVHCEILLGIL